MPATTDINLQETDSLLPLVSIGLPTFNGAGTITQAIKSVLKQSYRNIELIISDNASEDETEIICQRFCEVDDRIKYIRQPQNQGATFNFSTVLEKSSGAFFMWLGDDDWLEESYVYECVKVLINNSEYIMVGGIPNYFRDEQFLFRGAQISLEDELGQDRIINYYSQVTDNGIFYSLMQREQILKIYKSITTSSRIGAEYFIISALAFLGKSLALDYVAVNRNWNWHNWGTEEMIQRVISVHKASRFQAMNFELCIAFSSFQHFTWESPNYKNLSTIIRFNLGWDVLLARLNFRQLNIQTNLLDTFRFIDAGHGGQETGEAIANLRQVRLELAKYWFSKSPEDVANSYGGDYVKVQQILPITGIKDEPLTEEEQYFLEDIAACVMNRGFNHPAFMGYFLILMLYYYPYQFPQGWYEGVSIPEWFMDEFLKFLLVNPTKFADQYDGENYYNYAVGLVNYLHGKITTNQNASTWQYIRKFVGENANFYLLNDSGRDLTLFQQQLQEICS